MIHDAAVAYLRAAAESPNSDGILHEIHAALIYFLHDQPAQRLHAAAFPRRARCGRDHGSGILRGGARTGAKTTRRRRRCRWHEALSAKRQLPVVSWLGG